MEVTEEEAKTILFMSADIAQATAFKEIRQGVGERPGWFEPFMAFFRELPLVFMGQVATAFSDVDHVPEVGVWQVVGDEIIFQARPNDAQDAFRLVDAFYRSVLSFDKRLFEKWALRIRGCCWAADLHERNMEIEIPEMAGPGSGLGSVYCDYLGPDIDAGFRIAAKADPGHVIISVDLAEALAKLPEQGALQFHFLGREILKGVFKGRPYPLILITMADAMPDLWQWEMEESPQIRTIRDELPMNPEALIELAERIRTYLNRVGQLGLKPLDFSGPLTR